MIILTLNFGYLTIIEIQITYHRLCQLIGGTIRITMARFLKMKWFNKLEDLSERLNSNAEGDPWYDKATPDFRLVQDLP